MERKKKKKKKKKKKLKKKKKKETLTSASRKIFLHNVEKNFPDARLCAAYIHTCTGTKKSVVIKWTVSVNILDGVFVNYAVVVLTLRFLLCKDFIRNKEHLFMRTVKKKIFYSLLQ